MNTLWPWLTIAGLGALHGLSPANGWMFAAACGVRAGDGARARRALVPIAIGHGVSIAIVVFAVMQGVLMDLSRVQAVAGALLIVLAAYRALRGAKPAHDHGLADARIRSQAGDAGIALWSCLMATVHGAGLMLVPALVPLCMSASPAREITASGSMLLASAAVLVHLAAMLIVTGAIASGICRGVGRCPRLLSAEAARSLWTAALAVTGGALLMLR
ncbi:MAG: hypothetical protein ACREP7_10170 [Lysobacter sp.]